MKSWHIPRRALLKGALGTAIALPFLDAMSPSIVRAGTSGPPKRLIFIHIPVGFRHADSYTPTDTPTPDGVPYTLPTPLAPLKDYQKKVTLIGNLANYPANDGNGDAHERGTASLLTCRGAIMAGSTFKNGTSVDQLAASQIGGTALKSLQLGVEDSSDSGKGVLNTNISWADETTPVAKETDPSRLFDRLFSDLVLPPDEQARKRAHQASVLHYANQSANDLRKKLGKADQVKLDQYLTGIKELEGRLTTTSACLIPPPAEPSGKYNNSGSANSADTTGVSAHHDLMFDMLVHAFACDITRVASFMFVGGGFSDWNFLGFTDEHHYISHFPDDKGKSTNGMTNGQKLDAICAWEMTRLANLLKGLDAVKESDGSTVLDNTLIFVSSDVSDGQLHNVNKMPVILAGGGGKVTKQGQHIVTPADTPLANLYVSMLQFAGINATTFGKNGTGPLAPLMV